MTTSTAPSLDALYRERNAVVQLAALLADRLGYAVGWKDSEDPDWPLLFIELPSNGQLSWHLPKAELVDVFSPYDGVWDGHTTEEKYQRIQDFLSGRDSVTKAAGAVPEPSPVPASSPQEDYPDEDGAELPFVVQLHSAPNVHADWRFTLRRGGEDRLVSWSTPLEEKEATSLAELESLAKDDNLLKGTLPARMHNEPSGPVWLEVDGELKRPDPGDGEGALGAMKIYDRGMVVWGAQRPDLHEYFLSGDRLSGRLIFRTRGRQDARTDMGASFTEYAEGIQGDVKAAHDAPASIWVAQWPPDQRPFVLSREAIQDHWLPPKGVSALPKEWRDRAQEGQRFWELDREEALKAREAFARFLEGEQTVSDKEASMPWKIFKRDDQWCVYRIDDNDQPMGDSLGCHPTEEKAKAQLAALYANEPEAGDKASPPMDRCMECDAPPDIAVLWAEGRALAWFCEKHYNSWKKQHPDDEVAHYRPASGREPPDWAERWAAAQGEEGAAKSRPSGGIMEDFRTFWDGVRNQIESFFTKEAWDVAYVNDLPDSAFLYIEPGGKKDEDGKTVPRNLRHFPYRDASGKIDLPHLRNAIARLAQPATGKAEGERWLTPALRQQLLAKARRLLEEANKEIGLVTYKQDDGRFRWVSISSTAFQDRVDEIVTTKALQENAELFPQGDLGPLRFWHTPGLDVGDCDRRWFDGVCLIETGLWRDDPISSAVREYVEANPDKFTISIGFLASTKHIDKAVVIKGTTVRRLWNKVFIYERSLVPADRSANPFTSISTEGGNTMRKEVADALREIVGPELLSEVEARVDAVNAKALEDTAIYKDVDARVQLVERATALADALRPTDRVRSAAIDLAVSRLPQETTANAEEPLAELKRVAKELPEEQQNELDGIVEGLRGLFTAPESETPPEATQATPAVSTPPEAAPQKDEDQGLQEVLREMAQAISELGSKVAEIKEASEAPRVVAVRASQATETIDPQATSVAKEKTDSGEKIINEMATAIVSTLGGK